jgi:hypothetical protein
LKKFAQKTILLTSFFYIISFSPLFSQVSFDEQVEKFADVMNKSLPFASSMGLNWSVPYIGQLLGYPVHFGIGISLISTFTDNTEIAALGEQMGITIDESFIAGNQWFPSYIVSFRLGGIAEIPFDVGFKFGYLPDVPMWGSLDYKTSIYGFDINYALFVRRDFTPILAVGVGFDSIEGGATGTLTTVPADPSMAAVTVDSPAYMIWKSTTYKAKISFAQPVLFTGMSIFGGLQMGYSTSEAGINIGEEKNAPDYQNAFSNSSFSVSGYFGLGILLGPWYLDQSIMLNLTSSFDVGFCIGFRYQP